MSERIIIMYCVRFPSELAISLFAHESAKSFAALGLETIVVAPRRLGRWTQNETAYRTVYLPTIDLSRIPLLWEVANFVNLIIFSITLVI